VSVASSMLRLVDGITRCAKERYQVRVCDVPTGATRTVASPLGTYYADPFVIAHRGEHWLFVEEFHCPSNRGYIAALPVGAGLATGEPQRVLDPGCHTSFPFVFEHDGALYMLPETSRGGRVELYACERAPDRWRVASRLLDGVDCADSVLHRHEGLWYLVTSQFDERTSPRRWLAIYTSESLLSTPWRAHPVNRRRRYADRPHGYGRNAGGIIAGEGELLRPMQASTHYYGEAAAVMRVTALTPERYDEEPYVGEHIASRIATAHSTHHVSVAGDLAAWDMRTHTGYFTRVREKTAA